MESYFFSFYLFSGAEVFDRAYSDGSCLCAGIGMAHYFLFPFPPLFF